MHCTLSRVARRATLSAAIVAALSTSSYVIARDVGAGQTVVLDNENASPEVFNVRASGTLRVLNGSTAGAVHTTFGTLVIDRSTITSASGVGVDGYNGSNLTITDSTISPGTTGRFQRGLLLSESNLPEGKGMAARVSVARSVINGNDYAASIAGNGVIDASATRFIGQGAGSAGIAMYNGSLTLTDGSLVQGQGQGLQVTTTRAVYAPYVGSTLIVDGSTVRGLGGSAIQVFTQDETPVDPTIILRNGASLEGANGVALGMNDGTHATIQLDNSRIAGDFQLAGSASADVSLTNAATLTGSVTGDATMTLAAGTAWASTGNSTIASLALNGGSASFTPVSGAAYRSTTVRGDFSGSGGAIGLNVLLNEGGASSHQQTDRLLILGNVTTTGVTDIVVTPGGAGAATDTNGNGVIEADEGISLVQVGGASRADAFRLRGGYVAVGPFQYTLHAFGPGQADPAQNQLGGAPLNWDYRLANQVVCEGGCTPVDPGGPGPGDGGDPGNPEDPGVPGDGGDPGIPETPRERFAVAPQLPSYLSAPAALLTYGDMMNDGLHQRLGDIRQGASDNPVGGEVFARYLGGQLRYSSNLSFQRYGYDFDQQINALQLGGSLIALDGDNGLLRAGWAADKGTTRVTPNAIDGNSSAKYHAHGVSGWITWQHGNGFWVDGVIGATRYRGDVGTDLRGSDVGNLRAHGWTTSIEAGLPIAIGGDWTVEPRFQLKHQQLNFRDFSDTDGLEIRLGTAKQTSATLGGRVTRTAQPRFMPYASLDLTHTSNGDPGVDVSSEAFHTGDRFGSGRVGNAYRVAAGAVSQLGEHVQVYGEGTYQHFVGSYGMRGWAGNVGVRVSF
ncbi:MULTISPECIES: autotransporter outer membrane beta-barrel domain-containing protein [Luteibacter]|uniref:autotransporter family protein n=1 Tax=Luteibacter TaxID=242605 RepID=UPI00055F7F2F|nr:MULTISPECIES: autotransporter outer membrane beta-barrel domain-containing protein [unclassified Luteibacter]